MTNAQIAKTLRTGANADIWYDYKTFGDEDGVGQHIEDVQEAMNKATELTALSDTFGSQDVYLGDDGFIHVE
jgi:hypothetical protein